MNNNRGSYKPSFGFGTPVSNQTCNRMPGSSGNKNSSEEITNQRYSMNSARGRYDFSSALGMRSASNANFKNRNSFDRRNQSPQNSGNNNTYFNNKPNRHYFSDPLIISRLSQCIQNYGGNIDNLEEIVSELQRYYPDYRRRKRQAFKQQVKKAYEVISLHNSFNGDDTEMIEDDFDDDVDSEVRRSPSYTYEGDGDVNSTLEDSYMQQNAKKRKVDVETVQELINIESSDDDNSNDISTDTEKIGNSPSKEARTKADVEPKSQTEAPKPKISEVTRKRPMESILNSKKKFKSSREPVQPKTTFNDIGGNEKVLHEVTQLLMHMRHPEVYRVLGVAPPRGFLLHGPPGSGKTLLAHAIAGELRVPLLKVAAPELVGGLSGQSEERIRELFESAVAFAPCVLFIDEVDSITPNRETAHREMERRIVAQLLSSMDELSSNEDGDQVLVIGATNRPDSLDPALRRAGRFDREVCLGIPDRDSRRSILLSLSAKLRLSDRLNLDEVAAMTPGYVGADLKCLVTEAAIAAVNRLFQTLSQTKSEPEPSKSEPEVVSEKSDTNPPPTDPETNNSNTHSDDEDDIVVIEDKGSIKNEKEGQLHSLLFSPPLSKEQLEGVSITMEDFQAALKVVQPSAKREGFATVPNVKWEDIGSLQDIRHELQMAILAPVKYPKEFASMGVDSAMGVLLCGPPGCGKTLLAKAIANEAGINFISVKGPELLNMYVGESERAVRQCFQRARSSQPCVIFFDEIDALCPKRTNMENGASRVVNQLLTEMDGVEARAGVFLMAATNRPDIVDPAVMRPGRLDKVLYVGLPAKDDRIDILQALTKGGTRPVLSEDVDLTAVAEDPRCEGYTGADLAALVKEASIHALKEFMANQDESSKSELKVSARHFISALDKIRPSVSDRDKKRYEDLRLQYAAIPSIG